MSPSKVHDPTPASNPIIMPTFTGLDSNVRQLINSKFLAALTNRDFILREIRDCIISNDEERCRKLSNQVHAHWKSMRTRNGCIFVDNRVAIPNSIKEAVTDVFHATHTGSWGITELADRARWAFFNRDLLNRVRLCKACTEFGKNSKPIAPANKFKLLTPCVEPDEENQINFAGPIFDGQSKERYILLCIDRFSKYPSAKVVKNPNATKVKRFLLKDFRLHGIPRQIRLDQARCSIGNTVKTLCEDNNIELIAAPAERHRAIGLVERILQTLKQRLGCLKIEYRTNRYFNVKKITRKHNSST